jgi:hypothetical protein
MPDARLDALQLDINPLESALSIGYQVPGLVAHLFMPVYRVPSRTFKAPIYGTEGFQLADARRALHTEPNEVSWSVSYQEEALAEYALQMPIDNREVEAANVAGISLESRARMTCQRLVSINREKAAADLLTDTGTYDTGNSETVTDQWNDKTSGVSDHDPIPQIEAAKEVIRGKTGMLPNYCLMGRASWIAFRDNTYIQDRAPGGTGADSTVKQVTRDQAREILEIDQLFVAQSIYHTGAAFADMWSDCCILAYQNPNPTDIEEPTFGFTLGRQYAEIDGLPLMGQAGSWEKNPWVTGVWYGEEYLTWVALDTAGYLFLDTNS